MNCRSCGAPILFVTMQKTGKTMPLDAEPSEHGNILLSNGQGVVVKNPADARACGEKTYLSHFATCPNSVRHRKA